MSEAGGSRRAGESWLGKRRGRRDAQRVLKEADALYKEYAFDEAFTRYRRSLDMARDVGDAGLMALAHIGMGEILREKGDTDLALQHLAEGATLASEDGDRHLALPVVIERTSLLQEANRPAEALASALDAVRIASELAKSDLRMRVKVAELLTTAARCSEAVGDRDAAREYLQKARDVLDNVQKATGRMMSIIPAVDLATLSRDLDQIDQHLIALDRNHRRRDEDAR